MTTPTHFKNPLLDVPLEERHGLSVDIIESDWAFLKNISPRHGNTSTTINLLLSKLTNECRSRGIINAEHADAFESLVLNIGFIPDGFTTVDIADLEQLKLDSAEYQRIRASASGLRNSTSPRTPRKTDGRNVTKRASGKSDGDTKTENDTSSIQSGSGEIDQAKNS